METTEQEVNDIAQELLANQRLVEHPTLGTVKLSRATPRKERMIAEQRRKAYHSDIKKEDILARAELEKIAIARGLWSKEARNRMGELSRRIGEIMGVLDAVRYQSVEQVINELYDNKAKLLELCGEEVKEVLDRYFDIDQHATAEDRRLVMDAAPNTDVDDILDKADIARAQAKLLKELIPLRTELSEIQEQHVSLFADSLEDRAERVNGLAKIYYCATRPDESPLWPTFDAMWDAAPAEIAFLQQELFLFENGISDEYRNILEKHNFLGFTRRQKDTAPPSEALPEVPNSSLDGELVEESPPSSSEISESTE